MISNLSQSRTHEIVQGLEAQLGGRRPLKVVRGQRRATKLKLAHRAETLLSTNERFQVAIVYFLTGYEAFSRLYSIILSKVNDLCGLFELFELQKNTLLHAFKVTCEDALQGALLL